MDINQNSRWVPMMHKSTGVMRWYPPSYINHPLFGEDLELLVGQLAADTSLYPSDTTYPGDDVYPGTSIEQLLIPDIPRYPPFPPYGP